MVDITGMNDMAFYSAADYKLFVDRIDYLWGEARNKAIRAVNTELLNATGKLGIL